jgi:methylated-DNA-[protein]-cysteine S-methyltransferase
MVQETISAFALRDKILLLNSFARPSLSIDPMKLKQLTPFRIKVYSALCNVPEGKVTTYKLLANHVGCKSSQAIGQALKANPYAPHVPCHRVIASDRSIGGFAGARPTTNRSSSKNNQNQKADSAKIDKKIKLLISEGVKFTEDGRIDETSLYTF